MANEATLNTGAAPRPLPAALLRAARSVGTCFGD